MEAACRSATHRLPLAFVLLVILALGPGLLTAPAADPPPAAAFEMPRRIALRPEALGGAPGLPSTGLLEEDGQRVRIAFELPALSVQPVVIAGQSYQLLEIEGGGQAGAVGTPMLPTFTRLIRVPDRMGVSFSITALESVELPGYRPFPMQPEDGEDFVIDRAAYQTGGLHGAERVQIGAPAIARDLRVVPITFSPVRYDPSRDLIEVASRIEVEVRFHGVDLRNAQPPGGPRITPSFDRLYRNLVVNYSGPREEEQATSLGTYVIICPQYPAEVVAAVQPLVQWRQRKGFDVTLVTTAETGFSTNEIQAWLRNAYQTWENPPEFVTLVGDATGSIIIPCWWYSGGESDHPYVQLAGDDLLADAHIGRLSVESVDRLNLVVNKIIGYESTPYMAETDWYLRACLLGDPSYSGVTCIQVMQWLKQRLLNWGYTQVDTIFTPPWVSQFTTACNRGDTVFSYRGYGGVSGIGTGHIYALTNGWKMPYAIMITCGTGNFGSSTCYSEAWLRAGTPPSQPTGGIASVSTSGSTHTRYNNCVLYGAWRAIFYEDLFTFGESLTRAKYELYLNYHDYDYSGCACFTHWNNLMGDPAGEIWTNVPRALAVSHPISVPQGTNAITVSATQLGLPVSEAYVCLWRGLETHSGGYTDADGEVELPVSTFGPGEIRVTVTKHDHRPYLGSIPVAQADRFVAYVDHTIDDDESGTSIGNGDGLLNPTETIELPVRVRNYGRELAAGVTGTLSCDDPYVTILDGSELFGDIAAGASAWGDDDFDLRVDGAAPAGHRIPLGLDLQSGADSWHSLIELTVTSADLRYTDLTLYDFGTEIEPGEEGQMSVRLTNAGGETAEDLVGTLLSGSDWVIVTDAAGSWGTIAPGAEGENVADRFGIRAAAGCLPGHLAPLMICSEFLPGVRDTTHFVLQIGTATSSDPTGPDAYGYYAYDNTDTAYDEAPTYAWIEIAPNHGGPGTDVGLVDFGYDNDDSRVVDLPFPFTFYGETFTRATICSNGWIAMGATPLENQRNWTIPGVGAPPYLIAAMWDDLYQSGQDRVYHWYDAAQHRYIVEYSRVRTAEGNAVQVFEVIFYDPAYYATPSGDGEIVFQYDTFQNTDWQQQYSTVGIENADQTDGVLYSYFNRYTAGSAPILTGRAIKFTAAGIIPRGTLTGTIANDTNGGTPLAGALVTVLQTGQQMTSDAEGIYRGAIPIGIHTIIASHPSFTADTVGGVWIVEDQTTQRDFALEDIQPPTFTNTTPLPNTADERGPYPVASCVHDYSDLTAVTLWYNLGGAGWVATAMSAGEDEIYTAGIPGANEGTLVKYYLVAEDAGGLAGSDPAAAPVDTYEFWVLPALFTEEMESGAPEWQHYVVTDTLTDQWHLSLQRNHTPDGVWSWKSGDPEDGSYAPLCDGALESPPLILERPVILSFWHWIDAEISQAYPGYAYDGGLVEMVAGAGLWHQITPIGGYPYRIRAGSIPGPFAAATPVFSGTRDWTQVHFLVQGSLAPVRFRFRFGSDGAVNQEGWFIDDVTLVSAEPGLAATDGAGDSPLVLALRTNGPNPFRPSGAGTRIALDLPSAMPVRLAVFDLGGRLVCRLLEADLPAGRHVVAWDGRDARGHVLGCGAYFYVLETPSRRLAQRALLVR